MRIAVVASHAWSLPSPARTGDSAILLDLTRTLAELGHDVRLYAPAGSTPPEGVTLRPLLCSNGTASPTTIEAEKAALKEYAAELNEADVIHDCSVGKLYSEVFEHHSLATIWGGAWANPRHGRNIVAQSHAQRDRLLRGATDYEGTDTPDAGGPNGEPLKDCRVAWNGCDTGPGGYHPTGKPKQDFFLMLGRWHVVRGIEQGIELAKATGINLLIAGTDPEEDHPAQAAYARKICELVRGCDNISVEFLPMGDAAHHERKVELYSDARALLFLPQFAEPFGLPQVEAMACGTVVFAEDRGSCREVVHPRFLNARAAIDASHTWSDDMWALASSAARQRAVETFSRQAMTARYLELYEEVAAGRSWG